MFDLRWSWLCLPYLVCAVGLAAIGVVAALVRGDRVMRLGVIGAATTALPWALATAIACGTDDPAVATRLLRLGLGPVALVGPNFLLILLGVSGQLEHQRWIALFAGLSGVVLLGLCWGTSWTVPGVHRLTSGVFYVSAGPLTDVHVAQLALWLALGLLIARRSLMRGERRGMQRLVVAALALAAIGATDVLIIHDVVGLYPIAWLPATIACGITLHLELRTDLLRPTGFDRRTAIELGAMTAASVLLVGVVWRHQDAAPVALAAGGSALWVAALSIAWWLVGRRARSLGGHRHEPQLARLAELDDERQIADGVAALWRHVAIAARATWRADDPAQREPARRGEPVDLTDLATGARWALDPDVATWLVAHPEPLATADLATMWVGPIRPRLEAVIAARGATLLVPLVDRGALVGLVEADHALALRDAERGLLAESARAAARALSYAQLTRAAAREEATAREVEIAEAMRRRASASRDDELGPWIVTAEYRSAARTTGAAWAASLIDHGRLALLVVEGEAHGVGAALATAALTGAFVAATTPAASPATDEPGSEPRAAPDLTAALDEVLSALGASAQDVRRGGEPVATFVAVLDAATHRVAWACAGHPGGVVVELVTDPGAASGAAATPLDAAAAERGPAAGEFRRGVTSLGPATSLVVGSRAVRGPDAAAWHTDVAAHVPAGPRLAHVLVELAGQHRPAEDLLAVVIRPRRSGRRSATLGE